MSIPVAQSFVGPVTNPKNPASHQIIRPPFTIPQRSAFIYPVAAVIQAGEVGVAYSETISADGGIAPFTFSITTGSLPPGLTINASTGVVSGTPTTSGIYSFTVTITDSNSDTGAQLFSITIASAGAGGGSFGWVS